MNETKTENSVQEGDRIYAITSLRSVRIQNGYSKSLFALASYEAHKSKSGQLIWRKKTNIVEKFGIKRLLALGYIKKGLQDYPAVIPPNYTLTESNGVRRWLPYQYEGKIIM